LDAGKLHAQTAPLDEVVAKREPLDPKLFDLARVLAK